MIKSIYTLYTEQNILKVLARIRKFNFKIFFGNSCN